MIRHTPAYWGACRAGYVWAVCVNLSLPGDWQSACGWCEHMFGLMSQGRWTDALPWICFTDLSDAQLFDMVWSKH